LIDDINDRKQKSMVSVPDDDDGYDDGDSDDDDDDDDSDGRHNYFIDVDDTHDDNLTNDFNFHFSRFFVTYMHLRRIISDQLNSFIMVSMIKFHHLQHI